MQKPILDLISLYPVQELEGRCTHLYNVSMTSSFLAPPPKSGGAIHIISETEKILYFRTWSSYMKSIDTDPKLFSLFSERKISVRNQGDI